MPEFLKQIAIRARLCDLLAQFSEKTGKEYGLWVFDGFRTRETQKGLFETYQSQLRGSNPEWDEARLYVETRKYVAHPDEPSRFPVPPHNTGGAVDVGLSVNGQLAPMGTEFDDLTDKAATDYFERKFDPSQGVSEADWYQIRQNRRILFYGMRSLGFVNWPHEWWHYDLGNCIWADIFKRDWIYGEM